MNTFRLNIYTTERPFFEGESESLIVPTEDGAYGVMARHCDVIVALSGGELQFKKEGTFVHVAISPGVMEVKNNVVTVLTETAEYAEEIDYSRAMKQYEGALERMKKSLDNIERHLAQATLSRALTRLKVLSHQKNKI